MMLRAKFGKIKIRINLLKSFDSNVGHFDNKICYKIDKTNYEFSNEIADCCSIRLATLPQKDCKYQKILIRKFGVVDKGTDCDAQGPGFESSQR